jgi:pimeloyl-ACP methyl ester carboxylesterase
MSGPLPVLLIHGFASNADLSWKRTGWLDVLADTGRRVIAPDLLGHGSSPKPHDPAAYAGGLEDHVYAALDDVEGQVDAVGFSLGARTLLFLAGAHPERFRKLVVAGYGADLGVTRDPEAGSVVADAVEGLREPVDPISRAFRQAATAPGADAKAMAACLRRDPPPLALEKVTHPTLVVAGDADPLAWPTDALVGALADATPHRLKGDDHLGTMKDLRFLDAALDFLEG